MSHPRRILLVEDNVDVRLLLSDLLTDAGYLVTTAEDGQNAFGLLEAGLRPSVIMVDLMLPRVSGWDLLRHAQEDPVLRQVPTVIITGVPRTAVKAVADAIFTKPFDGREVIETVRALIDRAEAKTRVGEGTAGPRPVEEPQAGAKSAAGPSRRDTDDARPRGV